MIVFAAAFVGTIVGAFIGVGWLSIDTLLDTQTITEAKFYAVVGVCNVLAQAFWVAVITYDEFWVNSR